LKFRSICLHFFKFDPISGKLLFAQIFAWLSVVFRVLRAATSPISTDANVYASVNELEPEKLLCLVRREMPLVGLFVFNDHGTTVDLREQTA
jgi:hypothetical protein